jgi:hypothetical protein
MVQSAFYAFMFKANRRVSVNCVESFLKLVADKNVESEESSS